METVLVESPGAIAELLRSAAHRSRIQILTMLLEGEDEFSRIMESTELSKTALANHLNQLIEKRLIERIARGKYRLTDDGRQLLDAAVRMYRDSRQREEQAQEALSRRYTDGLIEIRTPNRKVISKEIEYYECWLSLAGAVASSLKALGVEVDATDVGGYSGYAFLINVTKGITSPSGPTVLSNEVWRRIIDGTESLGWKIERYRHPSAYPIKKGNPTPKDMEVAGKLFGKIKHEIEEKDRPVVMMGLFVPAYAVVNGYDGDSYVVTKSRNGNKIEELVHFYDLKAPGGLDSFFFKSQVTLNRTVAGRMALKRAVDFAAGRIPVVDGYVAGPQALDEWANVLVTVSIERQNYMGNSYVGACVGEGRRMCGEFLRRLVNKLHWNQSENLQKAAECYESGSKLMEGFCRIFPFNYEGKTTSADLKRGAEILRKVKLLEEEAVTYMEKTARSNNPED